jgi:uncharacterized protein
VTGRSTLLGALGRHPDQVDPVTADGSCPLKVRHPVMVHRWEQLTFLHWSFDPDVVQDLLPPGLSVDTYDGRAWVGLVPFHMWVAPPGLPALPWLGRFCETNVRTYVRDRHGRVGVWFFSLEAARLPAVVAARFTYHLPYFWASMRLSGTAERLRYTTRRRWPSPRGAATRSTVVVRPTGPIPPAEVTELEHFLTARWRLFSHGPHDTLRFADAEHVRWPLQRADIESFDDNLLTAAGLPQPGGEPLAHYSEGVHVRIGRPRTVT